jgi:hypothetical protein
VKAYTVTLRKGGKTKDIEVNAPNLGAVRALVGQRHPGWRIVRTVLH